jgi:hypothetical protein
MSQQLTVSLTTIKAVPDVRTRLVDDGYEPELQTGKAARDFAVREIDKWRRAVKASGVKANGHRLERGEYRIPGLLHRG